MEENHPGLALYNERRILRAYLSEGEDGTGLSLYDEQGHRRGSLEDIGNCVWLNLNNKQGNSCVQAIVTEAGVGSLVIRDGKGTGNALWSAP